MASGFGDEEENSEGVSWRLIGPATGLSEKRCRLMYSSLGHSSDVCLFYVKGEFFAMDARCAHSGKVSIAKFMLASIRLTLSLQLWSNTEYCVVRIHACQSFDCTSRKKYTDCDLFSPLALKSAPRDVFFTFTPWYACLSNHISPEARQQKSFVLRRRTYD